MIKDPILTVATYFNGDEQDFIICVNDNNATYADWLKESIACIKNEQGGDDEWANDWEESYAHTVEVYPQTTVDGYKIKLEVQNDS